jgi:prevent-host-death family protein
MLLYSIQNVPVHIKKGGAMIKVSATKLRNHLFDYLDKAAAGETIIIQRNKQEVARLVPTQPENWRERMTIIPQLLVTPEELIQPVEDIWADYL